jgi:hypothetical protein
MATIFLPNHAHRVLYRVVYCNKKSGKWQPYTNYHNRADAEMTACGLITNGTASAAHVLELDGRSDACIVAYVNAEPATGWPHGKAVIKRV